MLLFTDLRHGGFLIAQLFFGLWLLPLGYLVVRSGYVPKVLGVLLAAGGVGYLVDLFAQFLAPGLAGRLAPFLLAPATIGEVAFVVWLLVKAVRVPAHRQRPASSRGPHHEGDRPGPVRLRRTSSSCAADRPPAPEDDEVLVRVHAAGVDAGVWHLMTGLPYLIRLAGFGLRRPRQRVRGRDARRSGRGRRRGT